MSIFRLFPLFAVLIVFTVSGCKKAAPTAQGAPPPPKVTVSRPIVRDVTQWDEYTGRLEAVEKVDVKCQVSGFVESVPFTEGAIVKKGDVLLTIDSRIFKAQLENAQAAVEQAKAGLELAKATLQIGMNNLRRGEEARPGSMSAEELDTRRVTVTQNQASVAQAEAAIAVAEAAVKSAELNVEWCKVTAPITGRISSKIITPGNMLTGGSGTTTTITTITSVDPIYCYVDVDEVAVQKQQKLDRNKLVDASGNLAIPCYMGLADETGFPHAGTIDFVDNQVNPTTSTRRARGVFPNPDGTLLPGYFARFRVAGDQFHNALLVTDGCVGIDQDRKFIYVMHPDKTVERRLVNAGPLIEGLRVIESDLQPDDLVLVNGMAGMVMVPPGGTVDPTVVPMPEKPPVVAAATPSASTRPTQATTEAAK